MPQLVADTLVDTVDYIRDAQEALDAALTKLEAIE